MKTLISKTIAMLLILNLSSNYVFANTESITETVERHLPNNTHTSLVRAVSFDRVINPLGGYVNRHLYGQEVILKVAVKNFDYQKEIYISDGFNTRYVRFVSDIYEFVSGGAKALWVENEAGYDVIYLKISGYLPVSASGSINSNTFTMYLKMGPAQYTLQEIQIGRLD